ncbi:MAG TPA: biliverdin-producing heme oxygenase [Flavitalea sp.]|nr:biliverdin-producing heme oxygenase [Flavitalea sp.]
MFAEILKGSTLSAHASLEKKLIVHIKSVRSTADYVGLLLLLYPFHFYTGKLLRDFSIDIGAGIADLARAGYIRADLQRFGVSIENETFRMPELPLVDSPESVLGIRYVLEGSTLGGQIITRILSSALQIDSESGFSFFNPYRSETAANWQRFKSDLNSAAEKLDQQKIISAANNFFNSYNQWIRLHEPVGN